MGCGDRFWAPEGEDGEGAQPAAGGPMDERADERAEESAGPGGVLDLMEREVTESARVCSYYSVFS